MGLSLWLDRGLYGLSAGGHHFHSLLLYAHVSVIVYWLEFELLRNLIGALAAGLTFAVSPLHAEVAAAINYREDLLAAVGVLGAAALLFWPAPSAVKTRPYVIASLWSFALLGKESALVAPLLWLALALWRRPPRATLQGSLPIALGVVAVLWCNWRFGISVLGEQIPQADYASSWLERCLRATRFEVWSVLSSFWPVRARPEYDPMSAAGWPWWIAFAGVLAALLWLAAHRRSRRYAALLAVALVAPLVSSPLFAPANEFADRYWFTGSLAVALLVGHAAHLLARRQAVGTAVGLGMLTLVGLLASWSAASVWESEVSLWTFAVATAPHSPRAWSSLSRAHRMAGQEELAEKTVERALERRPDYVPGQVARVLNYLWAGHLDAARALIAEIEPKSELHREALRVAENCAQRADEAQARKCARNAVPRGLVLGDPEQLRLRSERLLAVSP
jgi:hypothetical protein